MSEEWKGGGDCRKCRRKPYCRTRCRAHRNFMKGEFTKLFVNACADVVQKRYGGDHGTNADEGAEGSA